MTHVSFDVLGVPAPQGSKTMVPTAAGQRIVEGRDKGQRARHTSWRDSVAAEARLVASGLDGPIDRPIVGAITFRFPMPASRPKRLRLAGWLPRASTPDLSKILRATEDALVTGGLIVDDRLIWRYERLEKIEVTGPDSWIGATITLSTNQPEPQEAA